MRKIIEWHAILLPHMNRSNNKHALKKGYSPSDSTMSSIQQAKERAQLKMSQRKEAVLKRIENNDVHVVPSR